MRFLTLIFSFIALGGGFLLNANTLWLIEQPERWFMVLQQQRQGQPMIEVYQQEKQERLAPKFIYKSQGQLLSAYSEDGLLEFVFPSTVFKLNSDQVLQRIQRAEKHQVFVGKLRAEQQAVWLLKDVKSGEFVWKTGDPEHDVMVSELSAWKTDPVLPWTSKSGQVALVNLSSKNKNLKFAWIKLAGDKVVVEEHQVEGFKFGAYCEDAQGLWLLPEEGTLAKLWDGQGFSDRALKALPLPHQNWDGLMELGAQTLYVSRTIKGVDLFLGDTVTKLDADLATSNGAQEQSHLAEQLLLFSLLILSFILFIQWRSRFQRQMLEKIPKVELRQRPASIFLRGLAFWMDVYFVSLPLLFISAHFYEVPLEAFRWQDIVSGHGSEQQNVLAQRMQALMPLMVVLVVTLSLYHILMERFFGGSLGKLFFRCQVVSLDGSPLTWTQCFVRALIRSLDFGLPIPPSFFFILLSPLRQSLGDRMAKTQVVIQSSN